jgi:Ca-activated chloride channel homolog
VPPRPAHDIVRRMATAVRAVGWLAALLFTNVPAIAFQGPLLTSRSALRVPAEVPPASIRVDASLVMIPVHVTTVGGAPITDLSKDGFRLFEEGVEQKITYFAKDDAPISIGVLLDTSGSMENKIRRSAQALNTFFKTANPEDEFFLIEFNERPKLTVGFTNDLDDLYRRIAHARPFGRTSLLDAVHLASVQMKKARNSRKALLIVSDGGDNRSRFTPSQVKADVLESDMQLYAIGIFDNEVVRKRTPEEKNGPGLLEELAEETGGKHYRVDHLNQLVSVTARISNDLRSEYLLGYSSTNAERDGKYRRVKVSADPTGDAKLRTYYRRGYYAPLE